MDEKYSTSVDGETIVPSMIATVGINERNYVAAPNLNNKIASLICEPTWKDSRVKTHRDSGDRFNSSSRETTIHFPTAYSRV